MLGGHGRRASNTDSRVGKVRMEAYKRGGPAGVKGLAIIVIGLAVIALVVGLLSAENLVIRYGSWVVGGLLVVGFVGYRWRRFVTRPSIHEELSDLGE